MKYFIQLFTLLLVCFSLSSCDNEETCYECVTAIDLGNMDLTFCEGDSNGSSGSISEDELEETVNTIRATGGTCTKQ